MQELEYKLNKLENMLREDVYIGGNIIIQTLNEVQQQVKNLNIPAFIISLPEYNEILYHAKTLTDEQFREYWNEVQGNVL